MDTLTIPTTPSVFSKNFINSDLSKLLFGEKTILIIHSTVEQEFSLKYSLSKQGYDQFCCSLSNTPLDYYRLRNISKNDGETKALESTYQDISLCESISINGIKALNSKIFGDRTFLDILDTRNSIRQMYPHLENAIVVDPQKFTFTKNEYYFILGRIKKGSEMLPRQSAENDRKVLFSDRALSKLVSQSGYDDLVTKLNELIAGGIKLEQIFTKESAKLRDYFYAKFNKNFNFKVKEIRDKFLRPSDGSNSAKSSGITSNFTFSSDASAQSNLVQFLKDQIQNLSQDGLIKMRGIDLDALSKTQSHLEIVVSLIQEMYDNRALVADSYVAEEMRRVNFHNLANDIKLSAQQSFEAYVSKINKSLILGEEYPINTISREKQRLQLRQLISLLKKAHIALTTEYECIKWQSYYTDLRSEIQMLIEDLTHLPQHLWVSAFNLWYYTEMTRRFFHLETPSSQSDLDAINDLQKEHKKYGLEIIAAKRSMKFHDILVNLKSTDKGLYDSIMKSDKSNLSSLELIKDYNDLISTAFPINTISKSDLDRLMINPTQYWDEIKYMDNENIEPVGHRRSDSIDEISWAKTISSVLLSYNMSIDVWQTKHLSVMIIAGKSQKNALSNILKNDAGKNVFDNKGLYHTLTEAILATDKKRIIVIGDALIDSTRLASIGEQIDILNEIKEGGISVIPFWTCDGYHNDNQENVKHFLMECGTTTDQESVKNPTP